MIHKSTSSSGGNTSAKAWIILLLSLLIPFTLIFTYVWSTATDIVFSDDIFLIKGGFIESYLKGSLSFEELWHPLNFGRTLGYNLLQLVNIKFFAMNSRILVLLVPFFMLASAILIYRNYKKSLEPENSPEFIAATFFIIALIIFNVIQWEGLIVGRVLEFQPALPFFIASFISLESFLFKGKREYLPVAFIFTSLAMLVFNGRLNLSFIPTLGIIYLCYLMINRADLTKDFWLRTLMISLFLTFLTFLYLFKLNANESSAYNAAANIFSRPLEALQFFFAALGSSIVGIDVFYTFSYISFNHIVVLGAVTALLYALALTLFFRSHMYERTYLPFFLILQTLFFLGFVMMGRFEFGKDYGMNSRYTCVSVYGLVALVWIFIFTLFNYEKQKALLKGVIFMGFFIIISGLLITSIIEWRIQPERKVFFAQLRDIAMRVDTATDEELLKIGDEPERVRDALRILREHQLNVYRHSSENSQ